MSEDRRQQFPVAALRFWGEQDGPPERELKERLENLFQNHSGVKTAYLANVTYGGQHAMNVALCVRTEPGTEQDLARRISEIFASLFGRNEHLDIIFLNAEQETAVAGVCRAFFPTTDSTGR